MSAPVHSVKKEAIYAAAARLFREKGYSATSMRELAAAVDLEASSLYSHISSKADLLDHICFSAADAFTRGIKSVEQSGESPLDQIRALIRLHVHIALKDPSSQTVFNDEWRHLPPERLATFHTLRRNYEEDFLRIIDAAKRKGQLKDIPKKTILLTILSGMRWLHNGKIISKKDQDERLAEDMCTLFLEGLCR